MITAHRDVADRQRGLDAGADDFLTLPVNRLELLARVRSLLRLRTYSRDLEDAESVVLTLASVLEARDPFQRGHSSRVGDLAARVGQELGIDPDGCELLRVAGLLHDIGRVGIPDAVMHKSSALSPDELALVRRHAGEGEMLCRPLKTVQAVLPYIRHHHERLDGTGYPDRLAGEEVPLGARILALADAFDAMTSRRAHRAALGTPEALALLATETEKGFWDARAYAALARITRADGRTDG
jgi:putative two-component system response regulator